MKIELKIDTTELEAAMERKQRHVPYAVVNTLNNAALRVQAAEVARAQRIFTIRKRDFMLGTAARPGGAVAHVHPFASVGMRRWYTEVYVGSPGTNNRLLLAKFEKGGIRVPFTPGANAVAVPLLGRPARPSLAAGVPYEFTFAGLHLAEYYKGKRLKRNTRSRKGLDVTSLVGEFGVTRLPSTPTDMEHARQWKGRQRTFLLKRSSGTPFGGVFQRIGPGRGDIREIYSFRKGDVVPALLEWVRTATQVSQDWMAEELKRQLARPDDEIWKG